MSKWSKGVNLVKMKIVLFILLCCALLSVFTACSNVKTERTGGALSEEEVPSMFVIVEDATAWKVVYHRDTKVMYTVSIGYYNVGNFTLLVNPDGTPMLYEG